MPHVTAYAAPGERTSPAFCRAFAQGAGGAYVEDRQLRPGDVALFGSPALWDLLLQARAEGRTWYYGDHGFFGRAVRYGQFQKGPWYMRVARGEFQAAAPGPLGPREQARAEAVLRRQDVQVRPWRGGGRHVLVCPPSPVYGHLMKRAGVPMDCPQDWGGWALRELERHTARPLRVRTKADAQEGRPLEADLEDCWAVVTFMSNVALEAVLAGVPAFILGPAAFRELGRNHLDQIESPLYPANRYEAARSLAAAQWTLEEIEQGTAWGALC